MVFPIYNIHIDKGRKTREASRGRTRVANKTPEENGGWWWVQRRERERASKRRAQSRKLPKSVRTLADSPDGAGIRVTLLGSPHPTPHHALAAGRL